MSWELTVRNIAGIRSGAATLGPGTNAVKASNWQGKSSFVRAIETVMGTEKPLTEGEDSGHVELSTPDKTYTVKLTRDGESIRRSGTIYLQTDKQRTAAALFAFLDDTNEVRTAVRNHDNLESVLLRPLEFENIDEQIADLSDERSQVETELERAREAANKRPELQSTVQQLETELEDLTQQRKSLEENRSDTDEIDDEREKLSELKTEYDSVKDRINRLTRTIDRTQEKLEQHRTELDTMTVPEVDKDLESRIAESEQELEALERDAELLQSVYAPTKRLLDENRLDSITDIDHDLVANRVSCWVCGSETTKENIENQLARVSDRIMDLRKKASDRESEIKELRERRDEIDRKEKRQGDLESEIERLKSTLEDRQTSLENNRKQKKQLQTEIEEMTERVETKDEKLSDIESDIKFTRAKLEDRHEELERLESQAERRDVLEQEYDDLSAEITRLRERKERMKRRTREAFDKAIQDILSEFNVGFEMVRLTPTYDLVVARDGREAKLSALSEGELELVGVVAALAGYKAFDVTNDVPIMILDGIGGLADDNVRTLVEYLEARTEMLVYTTYPENTKFEEHTIDPSGWDVVSHETEATQ